MMSLVMLLVGIALAFLYGTGTLPYEGATPAMNNTLFWLILILSVTSSLDFFLSLFTWYIYYKSHFIFEQILYLSLHIGTILGSFLFLYFGYNIIAVALVTGCVTVLFDAVGAIYAIGKLKMSFDLMDKPSFTALLKEVLKFSLYIFFMMIVSFINQNIGKTVLGHVIGMASVTIFGYGLQFYNYEAQIASAISSQFSPRVNKLVVEQKYDEINNLFTKVSRLQMVVLFLIVGGFAACGQDFINAWLQKTDLSSKDLTNIFYLSLGFLLLWIIPLSQQIGLEIQRAENKHKYLAIVNLACAVVSIGITVLCVFLLPNDAKVYGPLIGMGCSTIVGMIILGNLFYQRKLKLPIKSYFVSFAIYGLVAAASWAIVYFVFKYGIKLPTQWNLWYGTVIKGVAFAVLFVPASIYVVKKQKDLPASDNAESQKETINKDL
jgi:O-antigen/teichoic acid export membrane protein